MTVNGVGGADTLTVNDLTGVASLATLSLNGFDGDDIISASPVQAAALVVNARGGPGIDTIDYSASTTAVRANLGLGTTGLAATLGADQENPPTTHTGDGHGGRHQLQHHHTHLRHRGDCDGPGAC